MKAMPFVRLNVGDIFNDIDGTTYIKTARALTPNKEETNTNYKKLNSMILIPNKPSDARGQLRYKDDDVYCEVLDIQEITELHLENMDDEPESNL